MLSACGPFFSAIRRFNNPDHCSTAISEKSSERHLPGKRKHSAFAERLPLTGANGLVVPEHVQIIQLDDNWAFCPRKRSKRFPSIGMEVAVILPWKNAISPGVTKTASPGCKFNA